MSSDDEEDRTVQEIAPVRAPGPKPPGSAHMRAAPVADDPGDEPEDSTEASTVERLAPIRIKTPGYGEIVPRESASLPRSPPSADPPRRASVKIEQVPVVKGDDAPPPSRPNADKRRESTSLRAARAPLHTVLGLAPIASAAAAEEPEPPSAPDLPTETRPRPAIPSVVASAPPPVEPEPPEDSVTALNASPVVPASIGRIPAAVPIPPEPDSEDSITAQSITAQSITQGRPEPRERKSDAPTANAAAPVTPAEDEEELTTKGPIPLPAEEPDDSITTRAPRVDPMREPLVSLAERAIASVPRVAAHPASDEMDSVVSVTAQMPGHMADALRIAVTESTKGAAAQALKGTANDVPKPLPARRASAPSTPPPIREPMRSTPPPLPPRASSAPPARPRPALETPSTEPDLPPPSAPDAPTQAANGPRPAAPRGAPGSVSAFAATMPVSAAIPVLPPLTSDGEGIAFEPPRFDPPSQAALRGDVQLPTIQQSPPSWSSLPQGIDTSARPPSQGRWVALVVAVAAVSLLVPTLLFFYLRRGGDEEPGASTAGASAATTLGSAVHAPARLSAVPDELDDSDPRAKRLRVKPKKKR